MISTMSHGASSAASTVLTSVRGMRRKSNAQLMIAAPATMRSRKDVTRTVSSAMSSMARSVSIRRVRQMMKEAAAPTPPASLGVAMPR